jgi:hypothetical protein
MASSININQNNNTVSLQDQNRKITITDNVHEKTVNITQPITSVVSVNTGAQGIQGIAGTNRQNILTTDVLARHITASGDISSSGGTVTALSGSFSHIQATGALTGTASFSITASHAISASVEITKEISSSNADTASYVKADSIDQPFTTITASGNISSSGTGSFHALEVDQYIKHKGDADTFINFTDNRIRLKAGNIGFFDMEKDASVPYPATINPGGNRINFRVVDRNTELLLKTDSEAFKVNLYHAGNQKLETTTDGINITGSLTLSGSGHITASGDISASGNLIANGPFAKPKMLFTLQRQANNDGTFIPSASHINLPPDPFDNPGGILYVQVATQSSNGISLCPSNANPTSTSNLFNNVGSYVTLQSTSSGKFIKFKVNNQDHQDSFFKYVFQYALVVSSSGGPPAAGETVEMTFDNSFAPGTLNSTGPNTFFDKSQGTPINTVFRTGSALYSPPLGVEDDSPVTLNSESIFPVTFISKSTELAIRNLSVGVGITTASLGDGDISGSGTGSFGYMLLPNLPTSDPGVAGAVFRSGTTLRVSEG